MKESMNNYEHILPMKKEHCDAVSKIELAVNKNPWTQHQFISSLVAPHTYSLVLTSSEEIMGYLVFLRIAEEITILTIGVDLVYQGKGYGKMLISYAHSFSRSHNVRVSFLEVSEKNEHAITFYTRQGYQICGKRTHYYQSGDNALVMRCVL